MHEKPVLERTFPAASRRASWMPLLSDASYVARSDGRRQPAENSAPRTFTVGALGSSSVTDAPWRLNEPSGLLAPSAVKHWSQGAPASPPQKIPTVKPLPRPSWTTREALEKLGEPVWQGFGQMLVPGWQVSAKIELPSN